MTRHPLLRVYYRLKPLLPWSARMRMRRFLGRSILKREGALWPVNESMCGRPPGWKGWPESRGFALVLTHDVEGIRGLEKCQALAEIEMKHGFRSSFNFIPEGEYRVPESLLEWLRANGFEVGVHDLRHDGWLYRSRAGFRTSAQRINGYLKKWQAVGFRSGFMLHNLEWLTDLEVLYDASTFDWDPFEPQPDGMGTIFPFRVDAGEGRRSFIELPYTLTQDSTVFFVLRQPGIETWTRKLDWVASRGGMALLNVHPDYVGFDDARLGRAEFSAAHYERLLQHVRQQHDGKFWHALPREVAQRVSDQIPVRNVRTPLRVGMVTHSVYETDNRVMRYAETLARRGDEVEVIAVGWGEDHAKHEVIRGVHVRRVQAKTILTDRKVSYGLQLAGFFVRAWVAMAAGALRKRYDLVHVHNMPDFVAHTALVPRLRGAKLILDIHDLVPELFGAKFEQHQGGLSRWLLLQEEKWSAWVADHIIVANDLWLDRVCARSCRGRPCTGFVNYVDTNVFSRQTRRRTDDRKILLFHGSLSGHQGVDLVVRAMPLILKRQPTAEFHVYGRGGMEAELRRLADEFALGTHFQMHPPVRLREMPEVIVEADVGVVPKRADSFGDTAFSTKILEFMSQGVPVVVSSTTIDRFYFDAETVRFFPSGDVQALADAVVEVLERPELRQSLAAHGDEYVRRNCWAVKQDQYLQIVDGLCKG